MVRSVTLDVIAKQHSDLEKLARQFDQSADAMDRASVSARKHTSTLDILDREISGHRVKVRELAEEYNRTGKVEIFRNLRDARRDLREFERLAKDLGGHLDVTGEKGRSAFRAISEAAAEAVAQISHARGIVGKLAAAIPGPVKIPVTIALVGTAITGIAGAGGAITAALGLGGIATGIALQLEDPKVRDGLAGLGGRITRTFTESASSFGIQTRHGIEILNAELDRLGPKFQSIFGKLATYVNPLTQGVAKGIDGLVSGIDRAMGRAGPVITVISSALGSLGRTAGDALDEIAKGSRGGAMGLQAMVIVLQEVIMGTARLIHGAEDLYGRMVMIGDAVGQWGSKWLGWLPVTGKMIKDNASKVHSIKNAADAASLSTDDLKGSTFGLAGALNAEASAANTASSAMQRWNQIIYDALDKNMTLDQAVINAKLAVAQFSEAVAGNSTAMSGNSAASLALQAQLLSTIQSLATARDEQINAGESAREATDAYNAEVAKLLELAKNAGLSKDELDKLAGNYPINIITTYSYQGTPPVDTSYGNIPTGRIGGTYAEGGPVRRGVPILVGEKGPEIFTPSTSGAIIPNHQASGRAAAAAIGGAGAEQVIRIVIDGTGVLAGLRKEVRVKGGNVQSVLGSA